jgi:hypothetical protein
MGVSLQNKIGIASTGLGSPMGLGMTSGGLGVSVQSQRKFDARRKG